MMCTTLKTDPVSFAETLVIYHTTRYHNSEHCPLHQKLPYRLRSFTVDIVQLHSSGFQQTVGLWSASILEEHAATISWVRQMIKLCGE
jgi:hypothetical protein